MMSRSAFSVATILVLVGSISVSSAFPSYDVRELSDEPILLTEIDNSSNDQTTVHDKENLATRFIGDLEVGSRRANEAIAQATLDLSNPTSEVYFKKLFFHSNGIFHYLSIQNKEGSFLVACDTPNTLGSSLAEVNVRLAPFSSASVIVFAATHN